MDPTTAPDLDLQDLDPFDSVLSLEDSYYTEGHALGVADGSRAGRIEGRVFGLEKGFEKFVAMGALHGKAAEQTPEQTQEQTTTTTNSLPPLLPSSGGGSGGGSGSNPRLAKHITTLHALSEPASLSTQNDEDAVADFDDRFKRAQAKVKIVEKLVGEGRDVGELSGADVDAAAAAAAAGSSSGSNSGAAGAAEAAPPKGPKRIGVKMVQKKEGKRGEERSMEDFGGPMKGLRS
ncbi:hypothetical protein SLS58_007694 [Diplodia intermedia]|uniref:Essential protein Yae1 N-terminal domain-containing protein n=1 Tax=Diplodia intermedia TaxID=856260 RepID=A0ABR3TJP7_9PEZI